MKMTSIYVEDIIPPIVIIQNRNELDLYYPLNARPLIYIDYDLMETLGKLELATYIRGLIIALFPFSQELELKKLISDLESRLL